MKLIGLFFPAIISVVIRQKRRNEDKRELLLILSEYGLSVLFCNLFSMILITYVLGIGDVSMSAFESFPFFTKYTVIAVIIAFVMPYLEEIYKKYIQIKFIIEDKNENGSKNTEEK